MEKNGNSEECGVRKRESEAEGKELRKNPDAMVIGVVKICDKLKVEEEMEGL